MSVNSIKHYLEAEVSKDRVLADLFTEYVSRIKDMALFSGHRAFSLDEEAELLEVLDNQRRQAHKQLLRRLGCEELYGQGCAQCRVCHRMALECLVEDVISVA